MLHSFWLENKIINFYKIDNTIPWIVSVSYSIKQVQDDIQYASSKIILGKSWIQTDENLYALTNWHPGFTVEKFTSLAASDLHPTPTRTIFHVLRLTPLIRVRCIGAGETPVVGRTSWSSTISQQMRGNGRPFQVTTAQAQDCEPLKPSSFLSQFWSENHFRVISWFKPQTNTSCQCKMVTFASTLGSHDIL